MITSSQDSARSNRTSRPWHRTVRLDLLFSLWHQLLFVSNFISVIFYRKPFICFSRNVKWKRTRSRFHSKYLQSWSKVLGYFALLPTYDLSIHWFIQSRPTIPTLLWGAQGKGLGERPPRKLNNDFPLQQNCLWQVSQGRLARILWWVLFFFHSLIYGLMIFFCSLSQPCSR